MIINSYLNSFEKQKAAFHFVKWPAVSTEKYL